MSSRPQCPNCGGYKIDQSTNRIDPKTGQKVPSAILGPIVLILLLGAVAMCVGVATDGGPATGVAIVLMLAIGFGAMIWFSMRKSQAEARAYVLHSYYCNICGNRWNLREGESWPEVHVRPNLITKGQERLEEEEKQRQKQQQDAAALYHLTHRK